MKSDKIQEALGEIRDDFIFDAETPVTIKKESKMPRWIQIAAIGVAVLAAAAVMIIAGRNWIQKSSSKSKKEKDNSEKIQISEEWKQAEEAAALMKAEYPEAVKIVSSADPKYLNPGGVWDNERFDKDYDVWFAYYQGQQAAGAGLIEELAEFDHDVIAETFKVYEGQNTICAPANLYLAFAMLAEVTGGESRAEILSALHESSIEEVRKNASRLWQANYVDNGELVTLIANSIWLDNELEISKETLATLVETYYADIYAGDPEDPEYTFALRTWLNEKTGGKLAEEIHEIEMDSEMMATLVSTIYFCGKWQYPFDEAETFESIFHGVKSDKKVDYLYQHTEGLYYYFEHFSVIILEFSGFDRMYLFLPDEGYSPEEIARDSDFQRFIASDHYSEPYYEWISEHETYSEIIMKIPKFDITSDIDMKPVLQNLGVQKVFEPSAENLAPLLIEDKEAMINKIEHTARVMIDEEGCTATAFVLEDLCGAAMPEGLVEFTLDRPFLFAITSYTGAVLFTGTVNEMD